VPRSPRALRGFLGLAGFYRRFIKGYAVLASPLTKLLSQGQFQWSPEATEAFQKLKDAITRAPVLALPDFKVPFVVETDASNTGMGTVLSQGGHPIAFFSKQFCPRMASASTYIRELAAITATVKKWRQYLLGHRFTILTDHRSLRELMSQAIQTPEQHRYLVRLLGFDYTIQYRSGQTNTVADALSRVNEDNQASLYMLTMPRLVFIEDLRKELARTPAFKELYEQIQANPTKYPDHSVTSGLILHKGRIWLPSTSSFIKLLLEEFHQTPVGGHMGVQKTLQHLQENFKWDSMRTDVHNFIANCITCQQTKYDNRKPGGLLCPIPIPALPWEDLSMDFIVGLPAYKGNTCILVIVDRFSKWLHLGMLPPHHTAYTVALLFMEIARKLHGMPRSIISDRDPLFVSKFWKELFTMSGTRLRLSSAHPQTDGQTKVANQIIKQYLRAYVHQKPATWGHYLMWAEWSYNTSCHSTTWMTPFEITYGRKPPSFPQYITGTSRIDVVDELLTQREEVFASLRKKLSKAQERMKETTDKGCRDQEFNVGDWVLVKLRPHRQTSVAGAPYLKLAKRYYGPFRILDRLGKVAYKLQLPDHSKIHPVFHVSLLKAYIAAADANRSAELPPEDVNNKPIVKPLTIIASKVVPSETGPRRMVLVQWVGLPPEDASWEDWSEFQTLHDLKDKVWFEGQGSDTQQTQGVPLAEQGEDNNGGVSLARPKRRIAPPSYLEDYVRE